MKKILYLLLFVPLIVNGQTGFNRPLVCGDTTALRASHNIATWQYVATHGGSGGSSKQQPGLHLAFDSIRTTSFTADTGKKYIVYAIRNIVITLPTYGVNASAVLVKIDSLVTGKTVTINSGTGQFINKSGKTISLTLLNQGILLGYRTSGTTWDATANDLPLGQLKTYFDGLYSTQTTVRADTANTSNNGSMSSWDYKQLLRLIPLTNQTYAGQFNLSTNYEVYYNQYTTNAAITPTISASPLVGSVARVVFNVGASGSLVTTNLGTLLVGSDSYTVSKLNEVLVFSLPEGLYYSIKVLN